jgi:hypothetical protein
VWLKLKIGTKMRKGKYVSKIKTVYHLNGSLFKINPNTANEKKNLKGTHL